MNNRNTGLKILFGPSYSQWVYDPDRLSFITPYYLSLQTSKYAYQIYSQLLHEDSQSNLPTDPPNLLTDPPNSQNNPPNLLNNPPNSQNTQLEWMIALNRTHEKPILVNPPSILLWDMFGGIGTDSIYLSRYFNVIVTEIDKTVHDLSVKNVRTFNKTNINLVNDNCINMIGKINPSVVYFDPPWGNTYKSRTKNFDFNEVYIDCPEHIPPNLLLETPLDHEDFPIMNKINININCIDLLRYIHTHVTPYIIVKSPINSNTFERAFSNSVQYIHKCPNKNLKFIYLSR